MSVISQLFPHEYSSEASRRLAEYTTGLICASLVHLKPLIKKFVPHLLDSLHKETRNSNSAVQDTTPHVRHIHGHRDDRKYGYDTATTSPDNGDGAHDCRGETTVPSTVTNPGSSTEPRIPEKVYSWAPRICHQPEASLIRHASPV